MSGPGFALKHRSPNAPSSQFGEELEGINRFGQTRRSEPPEGAVDNESTRNCGDCAGGNRGPIHCPINEYRTTPIAAASNFDAHGAWAAFRISGPQHRESSREAVATGRRHSRCHTTHARECRNQNKCIGKFCSVAVLRTNGVREPAQFSARTTRSCIPRSVTPVDSAATKCTMMLTRARRTTGA